MTIPDEAMQYFVGPSVVAVLGYIGWFIRNISQSVCEIKGQIPIFLERIGNNIETLDDHELRIRKVESDTRQLN